MTEKKYPELRTLSSVFKIFAWIVGIATTIALVISTLDNPIYLSIIIFVVGILISLALFAISELIMLFIDIEYNTRRKEL